MSDIARRVASQAPALGGRSVQAGQQADLGGSNWEGTVLELREHVDDLPDLGGPEIASAFVALPGVVRRGGHVYRLRRGWRAQPGGIVVVDVRQPLQARPDGSFATSGPWGPTEVTTYRAASVLSRRTGDVADDAAPHDPTARPSPGATGQPPHLHDREALHNLRYLPTQVQRSVTTGVPDHRIFVAEAIRHTRGDGSTYHRVCGLRLGPTSAVVVHAAQQGGSRTWQVELVRFALPAGEALDAGPRAGALT